MAVHTSPVIAASVVDTNSTTVYLTTGRSAGNSFTLIKYHSNALATMTATPGEGAAINEDMYIIRNGNRTGYGKSHTFEDVESNVFTFSAEDDSGYVGTRTITATMIDYIRLTCNIGNSRPDTNGDMTLTCSGNFFNDSFGAVSNSLTVEYSYTGSDGSSDSGVMTVTNSGNTYAALAYLSGLDYQASYTFVVTATDKLESVTSTTRGVKSVPVFHWGEADFAFEVPVAFNGSGTNTMKGDLRLKGDDDYGNTLYFGDGTYCSISEPSDDEMKIRALELNLAVPSLKMNGTPVCGTWTPELDFSSVSEYVYQYGWYLRLGDVVVIGWNVRAKIDANSHSIELVISGAPFEPSYNAFGGGVAYNIYTPAGFNFEAWGIDTNGEITAKLQPCNGTSAGNLPIASTAGYPYGGGTVTLAGTICYMV